MAWADRELVSLGPLSLEGQELAAKIRQDLKVGTPTYVIEKDVMDLRQVLQALREERLALSGREAVGIFIENHPEYRAAMVRLNSTDSNISPELKSFAINFLQNGENYVT